jgi:hypothetical protein
MSASVARNLEREVSIMAGLRHPCIVLFMGVCLDPPAVVTEFCARGSLYDVLAAAGGGAPALERQLTWARRLNMALDAAKASPSVFLAFCCGWAGGRGTGREAVSTWRSTEPRRALQAPCFPERVSG